MLRRSAADRYAPNTRASVPRLSRPDVIGVAAGRHRVHEVGHGPQERVGDPARVEVEGPRLLARAVQGQRVRPPVRVVVHQAERALQGALCAQEPELARTAARAGCSGSRPPAPGARRRSRGRCEVLVSPWTGSCSGYLPCTLVTHSGSPEHRPHGVEVVDAVVHDLEAGRRGEPGPQVPAGRHRDLDLALASAGRARPVPRGRGWPRCPRPSASAG